MNNQRWRTAVLLLSSLVLAAALAFVLVSRAAALESAAPLPVLGVDPLPEGFVVEHHPDALPHWVKRGIAGAVLLLFDVNNDVRSVGAGNLAALKALHERGDIDALIQAGRRGESGLYHEGNFVSAAAGLGIVREVVWVVPFAILSEGTAGKELKAFLGGEGLSSADIETFRPADGCYRGTVGDLPVAICSQDRLPRIDAPVVLSMNIGFLPYAADSYGLTLLTEIRSFFAALRAARYSVRDAVVAYSVQTEQLPVQLRWVGDAVLEILRNPELIRSDAPPERWNALQQLFLLRSRGQQADAEMLNVALSLLEKQPHDPALLLFAAEASARHGGGAAALSYAEQACTVDPGYCAGLRDIGLQFCAQGKYEIGARFFASADRLQPGTGYRAFDMGIALWLGGRTAEALDAMERFRARTGVYPSEFIIGAMHAAAGDRAAARLSFDKALAAVERTPSIVVVRQEVAQAIQRAAAFYREEGLTREAALLETDPRLLFHPPATGP